MGLPWLLLLHDSKSVKVVYGSFSFYFLSCISEADEFSNYFEKPLFSRRGHCRLLQY